MHNTMFSAAELVLAISHVINAHSEKAIKESKRFRKVDGKTPYGIHPVWCALTILTETLLDEKLKVLGAWVLFNHDLIEDTTANLALPSRTELHNEICFLVGKMTLDQQESKEDEREKIRRGSDSLKLLKLYDKASNLLDGSWMDTEKRRVNAEFVCWLAAEVGNIYGDLNIVKIAKSIV